MIGVIAKLAVNPDKAAEFETHAKALVAQVTANEAGCHQYELFKSADGATYVFMEKYADEAALKAHGQTDYFLAAQAPLGACLAGAPEIEVFHAV